MAKNRKLAVSKRKTIHNRWKKGQSCLSNPECNKYRSAAKSGSSVPNSHNSNLTFKALQKFEDKNSEDTDLFRRMSLGKDQDEDGSDNDVASVASSNVSNCTNATFSKIIGRYTMSNLPEHKEIISILEGAAEVIKEKGGEDSDVQYVAMLTTLLKSKKVNGCKQVEAILFLLSLCIKRVPQSLLRLKHGEVSKVVMEVVTQHVEQASQSFVKSAIAILCSILRSLSVATWQDGSTKHTFYCLLCMLHSTKPKVRKSAQQGVASVLRGSYFMITPDQPSTTHNTTPPPITHPACHDTAVFCIDKLEAYRKGGDMNTALYMTTFLGEVMSMFNRSDLKASCEVVLKLNTLSDSVMKVVCMNSLQKTFSTLYSMKPRPDLMPPDLNAQIISAVFEHRPSEEDHTSTSPWLQLLQSSYSNLSRIDHALYLQNLPRLFEACLKCMKAHPANVVLAVKTIDRSLYDCNDFTQLKVASPADDSVLQRLCRKLEGGLTYQYMAVWVHVLEVAMALVQTFGRAYPNSFKSLMLSLNALRSTPNFPHEGLLNKVFGRCVSVLGPDVLLHTIPLNITATQSDDLTFPRSWLLPMLRDNVTNTQLSFFIDHFIPLANAINIRCSDLEGGEEKATLRAYQVIRSQLWSLLPAFCNECTDLLQAFPRIAQLIGKMVSSDEETRLDMLSALRKVVSTTAQMGKEQEKTVVARYSKNFLPLFCNLYTSTQSHGHPDKNPTEQTLLPTPHNLALLETFKSYLTISDQTVVDNCVKVCFSKIKGDLTTLQKRLVMDLVIALTPHMSASDLQVTSQHAMQMIESEDEEVQKKNYRILEEFFKMPGDKHHPSILPLIQPFIHAPQPTQEAKAARLQCLRSMVKILDEREDSFYKTIIPEVVLCLKAVNNKAREHASSLMKELAESYVHHQGELYPKKALVKFIGMLLPGLNGSENLITCTLYAVSTVVEHLEDEVTDEVVSGFIESLVLLLESEDRAVVGACLGGLHKMKVTGKISMQLHLTTIMTAIAGMSSEKLQHFRFKIKEIYVKLAKWFGVRTLIPMAPTSHHKMLNNIRKEQDKAKVKKKKKKAEGDDGDDGKGDWETVRSRGGDANTGIDEILNGIDCSDSDDDAEDDDDDDGKSKKSLKSRKSLGSKKSVGSKKSGRMGGSKKGGGGDGEVWLKEGEGIIDFLDPSASQQVFATRPGAKKKEAKEMFKTMPDGRIIIPDDRAEEKQKKQKTEIEEAVDMIEVVNMKNRKRRISMKRDDSDDERASCVSHTNKSQFSYKTGGSGIHRATKKKPKKLSNEESGDKFKAKKAKGDVKKGSVDPYAYYPLDARMINKRNKSKPMKIVRKK